MGRRVRVHYVTVFGIGAYAVEYYNNDVRVFYTLHKVINPYTPIEIIHTLSQFKDCGYDISYDETTALIKKEVMKMITIRSTNYTSKEKQILADGLKNFFLIGSCENNKCSECEIRTLCSDIKLAHAYALKLIEKGKQDE